MSWNRRLAGAGIAAAIACLVGVACSSSDPGAGASGDCAAVSRGEAGGEALLGTGYDDFEALGDEIHIIAGPQGGFHVNLNARIRGLDFGNTDDLLDPHNPSTFFATYLADSSQRVDSAQCPVRLGYRADGAGDFGVLQRGVNVVFDPSYWDGIESFFGRSARLEVEIVDDHGRHARDARTLTLRPPIGFAADAGTGAPADAGEADSDAGVAEADAGLADAGPR